ncbi:tRNA nucleotidyltransferase/poly(A) polymerase [Botrimarina colliarenosi]|uniref:tRNA nucleotidyltransferase/poly(A) polymerase n=1 Tax=Botrimarina colliarenosi TaxID=2528001 RepID=A0A5C6A9L3_9BACT|nr:CCA tRNA nucleotidyltransferase [Botrimarina colliarenosi]TWT96008.1 tRNA nucleotidyltransferase/poly(A) polymerase [Botrimarina colliarenosi]
MTVESPQRDFAVEVVRRLRDAGHEALWAGGCVRDQLLGKTPKDYDVATDAPPDVVRALFGKRRTLAVGAAFGVITVLGPKDADPIEVATFRNDGGYSDGRRPDSVEFTSAEEDAKRRDFTINGMFYDPTTELVIDFVGGQVDLAAGVVRAIGDADERFAEDRLRMLRAVRFAASLRFALDRETADAIRRHAEAIRDVSAERIGVEVRRMLTETDPPRAVRLLTATGLLPWVLPPLAAAGEAMIADAEERLGRLESPSAPLALAATLLDAAEPAQVAKVGRSLRWTNREIDLGAWLVEHHDRLDGAESSPWSQVQPLLAAEGGPALVSLRRAAGAEDAAQRFCEERLAWRPDLLDPAPLLVGADLIAAGKRPGPDFGSLLQKARAAQLDGEVTDKQQSLRLLGLS